MTREFDELEPRLEAPTRDDLAVLKNPSQPPQRESVTVLPDPAFLAIVDRLEQAFDACPHPYVFGDTDWCNVCGARRLGRGPWLKPHWRDVLARAVGSLIELGQGVR